MFTECIESDSQNNELPLGKNSYRSVTHFVRNRSFGTCTEAFIACYVCP